AKKGLAEVEEKLANLHFNPAVVKYGLADQMRKELLATREAFRGNLLAAESAYEKMKKQSAQAGLALVGLDAEGQPTKRDLKTGTDWGRIAELRGRYGNAVDGLKTDIADIEKAVADGVVTREEGARLLAEAGKKLEAASQ
ncbi:hypothetical protein QR66_19265, partial [Chromobacterium piscinae]